ncbi:hypothetical protein [Haloprofundus salilacus]|uniref:hypothetical protein n=1 Tax=Haloprofundus salilacus TaxID=2876190 RepID=UPI001CCC7F3F|nr:hypothetical protein [Haloprofundus salilacus]
MTVGQRSVRQRTERRRTHTARRSERLQQAELVRLREEVGWLRRAVEASDSRLAGQCVHCDGVLRVDSDVLSCSGCSYRRYL